MKDWLYLRSVQTPDLTALDFYGETYSYAELQSRVSELCGQLHQRGLREGARVAIHLENGPETLMLVYALARLGVVIVPLNTRLTAAEIGFQLDASRVEWLIATVSTPEDIRALAPPSGLLLLSDLDFKSPTNPKFTWRELNLDAPWGIIFTSGTTGKPKGAVLTYSNLYFSALASAQRLGLDAAKRWLLAMPLYHIGGLSIAFRCCLYGTTVVLHAKFDPDRVDLALASGDVSLASLVPTMLQRILRDREWKPFPKSLQMILLGGAAASPHLLERCMVGGIPIANTYGLSEASSQVATALPTLVTAKPGCVGQPLQGTEVRILNDQGLEAHLGEIGEIVVRGPTVMAGYLQEGNIPIRRRILAAIPELPLAGKMEHIQLGLHAAEEFTDRHWFNTGDLGYLDEDCDLWVVQRRSDLIVTGGENVYPAEVEQALECHPGVEAAFVFGPPDEEWGQCVSALVVPSTGGKPERNDLLDFLRDRLAGYKVPRKLQFVPNLPLTASGKIDRREASLLFKE